VVPPAFNKEEYHADLSDFVRQLLRQAAGGVESGIQEELEHIGSLLDARIATAQVSLQAAIIKGDHVAEDVHAWQTFALLRNRWFHDVPSAPKPLLVPPAALHAALDR
jgi:hypothetical protein